MANLNLKIISPSKTLFNGAITFVKLPGTNGDFSLLSNHAPFISSLKEGVVLYRSEQGAENTINITSGFVEISNNEVTVCVESVVS